MFRSIGNKVEDFGYFINESNGNDPNVIFNIFNVFQLVGFNEKNKEMEIQYGAVSDLWYRFIVKRE